jgi:2-polyprenyl-3-methyl-5-hydroxy-6-metoxy-1,4-benzoquinol methylase
MNSHTNCLICKSPELQEMKGYEKHFLVKCSQCSFVFIKRIPSLEELDKHYSTYAYADGQYLSPITKKRYEELLAELKPYMKTGKILDVGCGGGHFLATAKEQGWEVHGTEFSQKAVELCQEQGINVKEGVLDIKNYDTEQFDVITSFEVIEHINNPLEEITKFYKLLRPGGLLYVTTPNFNALNRYQLKADYDMIQYPDHLSYYTPTTIQTLFQHIGFKRHVVQTTGFSLSIIERSQSPSQTDIHDKKDDEQLRHKIEGKWYLQLAKKTLNSLFTLSGTGMTIKAYYQKPLK